MKENEKIKNGQRKPHYDSISKPLADAQLMQPKVVAVGLLTPAWEANEKIDSTKIPSQTLLD
jgi:hypothetical protein